LVTPDQRFALWTEVEHLLALYRRHGTAGRELLLQRLEQLRGLMPPLDPRSDLSRLLRLNRWDLAEEELATRIRDVTQALLEADSLEESLSELSRERLPAASELGRAIGQLEAERLAWAPRLLTNFSSNPDALIGYLQGRVESGDAEAFDDFLDGDSAGRLSDYEVAAIATSLENSSGLGRLTASGRLSMI
jgi:Rad3-related DNA helicase